MICIFAVLLVGLVICYVYSVKNTFKGRVNSNEQRKDQVSPNEQQPIQHNVQILPDDILKNIFMFFTFPEKLKSIEGVSRKYRCIVRDTYHIHLVDIHGSSTYTCSLFRCIKVPCYISIFCGRPIHVKSGSYIFECDDNTFNMDILGQLLYNTHLGRIKRPSGNRMVSIASGCVGEKLVKRILLNTYRFISGKMKYIQKDFQTDEMRFHSHLLQNIYAFVEMSNIEYEVIAKYAPEKINEIEGLIVAYLKHINLSNHFSENVVEQLNGLIWECPCLICSILNGTQSKINREFFFTFFAIIRVLDTRDGFLQTFLKKV